MWMAKTPQADPLAEPGAELGQVTLAGPPVGVALAGERRNVTVCLPGERRNVTVCLPGGYHWTPQPGQAVLVVKSGPEGSPCLVGAPEAEGTVPGEVWLSVAPGVGVRLTKDGKLRLQGPVEVDGTLTVNGQEVVP